MSSDARELLDRALDSGRLHSAYLISGPPELARQAALDFARGAACQESPRPCENCTGCRRSSQRQEIELDGEGKKGPLLRHVGDHADLFWVERGPEDTRVRIGQIRALQQALRLRGGEGGHRVAVIADAELLNAEAQNALLRLLEEPPPATSLVLVTEYPASLLATTRSRCQKVALREADVDPLADPEQAETLGRLEEISRAGVPELLAWAEEYRGARAVAAKEVEDLLLLASAWLSRRIATAVQQPDSDVRRPLQACRTLSNCRKSLVQRNANPRMVAERALLAVRAVVD